MQQATFAKPTGLRTKSTARAVLVVLLVALAMPLALVGCTYSGDSDEFSGSGDSTQPDPEEVVPDPPARTVEDVWSCEYTPTINNNWHDDVLCSRGLEQLRPILLPNQNFVTEAEMRSAAADYESKLNANG